MIVNGPYLSCEHLVITFVEGDLSSMDFFHWPLVNNGIVQNLEDYTIYTIRDVILASSQLL